MYLHIRNQVNRLTWSWKEPLSLGKPSVYFVREEAKSLRLKHFGAPRLSSASSSFVCDYYPRGEEHHKLELRCSWKRCFGFSPALIAVSGVRTRTRACGPVLCNLSHSANPERRARASWGAPLCSVDRDPHFAEARQGCEGSPHFTTQPPFRGFPGTRGFL